MGFGSWGSVRGVRLAGNFSSGGALPAPGSVVLTVGEGDPVALRQLVNAREARRRHGVLDERRLVRDDAGDNHGRVRGQVSAEVGRHAAENLRDDIGKAQVELPARERDTAEQIGFSDLDLGAAVLAAVVARDFHGDGVDVIGGTRSGAQFSRADGEDPRAGADVENALAAREVFLEKRNHEAGRLMRAGAERHAGIHADDDLTRRRGIGLPCGDDRHPAKGNRLIILFPRLRPVLFVQPLNFEGDGDPERGKAVAKKRECVFRVLLLGEKAGDRDLGAVGGEQFLVDELAVHAVRREVAVILNHQSVIDHAHHGGDAVEVFRFAFRRQACPCASHIVFASSML